MTLTPELQQIYLQAFNHCMDTIESVPSSSEGGPANPLVIKPPVGYFESGLKVMYFGQESNGWEGPYIQSSGIGHLLGVYDEFVKPGRYGGHFWNAIWRFQDAFKEADPSSSFLYNNLIKIGKEDSKGRPCKKVLDWQEPWFDVIRQEVRLLKPDVVIFFSGPRYDDIIERVFGSVELSAVGGYSIRQVACVHSDILPARAFRTYHPGYLWRFGLSSVRDAILQAVRQ